MAIKLHQGPKTIWGPCIDLRASGTWQESKWGARRGPVRCSPGADFGQQADGGHHGAAAVPGGREGGVDGETALLWQQHGLHRLHHLLCDGELVQRQGLVGRAVRCKTLSSETGFVLKLQHPENIPETSQQ